MIKVKGAAIFSNYLSFKKVLEGIKPGKNLTFNFSEAKIIDHTFLEHLHHFEEDYHATGGHITIQGIGKHKTHSEHPLSTRVFSAGLLNRMEFKLNDRQMVLRDFRRRTRVRLLSRRLYATWPSIQGFPYRKGGKRILYEENLLSKYDVNGKMEISDITLSRRCWCSAWKNQK